MRIGFIGAGNMASALAAAIAAAESDVSFTAYDVSGEALERFGSALTRFSPASDNRSVLSSSDLTFLAVKPQVIESVLPEIAETDALVVSIAAGIRVSQLESALPAARVVRVMPNTPALVGEMAAGYSPGSRAGSRDLDLVGRLLSAAGIAIEVPEELLDAVTGVSGSGPAFVARLIEAFTRAGVVEGLSHEVAYRLVLATFSGTARLLEEKGLSPEELVKMVSSPGGTTVAGRRVLESSDLERVIGRSVAAAAERSRELGS
ncbi:MAG: pyrroline-5-carboxylate reductase [Spirochaetota bacterium]